MAALRLHPLRSLVTSFSRLHVAPLPPSRPLHTSVPLNTTAMQRMKRTWLTPRIFHREYRKAKRLLRTRTLSHSPCLKGVVQRVYVMKPSKPNSALRKVCRARLSNGKDVVAYIPGEGHNLQEHAIVLIRKGNIRDLQAVRCACSNSLLRPCRSQSAQSQGHSWSEGLCWRGGAEDGEVEVRQCVRSFAPRFQVLRVLTLAQPRSPRRWSLHELYCTTNLHRKLLYLSVLPMFSLPSEVMRANRSISRPIAYAQASRSVCALSAQQRRQSKASRRTLDLARNVNTVPRDPTFFDVGLHSSKVHCASLSKAINPSAKTFPSLSPSKGFSPVERSSILQTDPVRIYAPARSIFLPARP